MDWWGSFAGLGYTGHHTQEAISNTGNLPGQDGSSSLPSNGSNVFVQASTSVANLELMSNNAPLFLPPLPTSDPVRPKSAPPSFDPSSFQTSFPRYGLVATERRQQEEQIQSEEATEYSIQEEALKARDRALQVLQRFEDAKVAMEEEALKARAKALLVLQRFEEERDRKAAGYQYSPMEYAQKRKQSLERLEQRKKMAMLKNLEYLAKLEERRHQARLQQVQELQTYHEDVHAAHERQLQARSQNAARNISSTSGIGTEERQKAERKRRRQQEQSNHASASVAGTTGTVAIYVSNLPTDGSASDDYLRALFGALGYTLRKIHFYHDKQTGALKGDALAIYHLPQGDDRKTLVETVCSQVSQPSCTILAPITSADKELVQFYVLHQMALYLTQISTMFTLIQTAKMNGAELPNGCTMKVEPSDPLYSIRKKKTSRTDYYGPAQGNDKDHGAELDDFFESLEKEETTLDASNQAGNNTGVTEAVPSIDEPNDDLDDFFDSLG